MGWVGKSSLRGWAVVLAAGSEFAATVRSGVAGSELAAAGFALAVAVLGWAAGSELTAAAVRGLVASSEFAAVAVRAPSSRRLLTKIFRRQPQLIMAREPSSHRRKPPQAPTIHCLRARSRALFGVSSDMA
ncbi:hypothetical protein TIFTF001_009179 [Ficus carica]|uniref:Uncharacterized protein n=1 Tax=Ficus carica TaxID=3494 RepID=A0AA87ZPE3_FICCA|nr:hypothetical protein TIFTF001_009179 [Ficus carica]